MVQPLPQHVKLQSKYFRPHDQRFGFAAERNVTIITTIALLLGSSSPPAVAGFIIAVVINPVYAVLVGWNLPHIGIKGCEVLPSVANRNSAPAVIGPMCETWILATTPHRLPNPVFETPGKSMLCG